MQNPQTFRRAVLLLIGGIVAVGAVSALRAQAPDTKAPAFEVASVKPNKSGEVATTGMRIEGTQFRSTNITLRILLEQAYGMWQDSQLIGGPSWIDTDRFDIVARAERPGSPMFPMVRTLLADRFKLVTHQEKRELPIYALIVVRRDGRLGSKLHPSDCVAGRRLDSGGISRLCSFRPGPDVFLGDGVSLSILATNLSWVVRRPVVDRTGLVGIFDIDLRWMPDVQQLGPSPETAPPVDADAPSIFTAVQEQLGLKLESTKGPVDVLVIDQVEQPTPD
jgi:uncharacterized protein (TIGR03435 family)